MSECVRVQRHCYCREWTNRNRTTCIVSVWGHCASGWAALLQRTPTHRCTRRFSSAAAVWLTKIWRKRILWTCFANVFLRTNRSCSKCAGSNCHFVASFTTSWTQAINTLANVLSASVWIHPENVTPKVTRSNKCHFAYLRVLDSVFYATWAARCSLTRCHIESATNSIILPEYSPPPKHYNNASRTQDSIFYALGQTKIHLHRVCNKSCRIFKCTHMIRVFDAEANQWTGMLANLLWFALAVCRIYPSLSQCSAAFTQSYARMATKKILLKHATDAVAVKWGERAVRAGRCAAGDRPFPKVFKSLFAWCRALCLTSWKRLSVRKKIIKR